ncbi:MAG: PilZ domain-containing protein [Phycisphaerae bacterium]
MSTMVANSLHTVFEREISRFLSHTSENPTARLYRNRRAAVRHHKAVPLFVARFDQALPIDIGVRLHDISTGGLGFYSRWSFPVGTLLGVKLFWADQSAPRIPAVVRHYQIKTEGVLVGAAFVLDDLRACERVQRYSRNWYG